MARPYALRLQDALSGVAASISEDAHPLLCRREVKTVCYLVVTADRGLCGGFNTAVIKRAQQVRNETPADQRCVFYCVGKKGYDHFKRRDVEIVGQRIGFFNDLSHSDATSIGSDLRELYESGAVDQVVLIFNEFKSAIQQILHSDQLLPVVMPEASEDAEAIFEPNLGEILNQLLPMYLNRITWRVLLDSFAAEQGARMTAMESATENASDMLSSLNLVYNRSRQAAITQEISEIVSGAAAIQ